MSECIWLLQGTIGITREPADVSAMSADTRKRANELEQPRIGSSDAGGGA